MRGFWSLFKTKYDSMSLPIKAGFWFTVCNFLQRGITMITTPVFTRVLPEVEYGLTSTFAAWHNILTLITTLSLCKAIMNLYTKYDNKKEVLSAVSGLSLLLTIGWLVVYLFFADEISSIMQISKVLATCLFVTFIAQAGINCWMTYKRYIYEYKSLIVVSVMLTAVSSILGAFGVVFVSKTAEGRLIPQTVVTAIIGIVIYTSIFKQDKTFYNKGIWLFSLSFCMGLLPHYLSEFVLQSSDKLMINYMCGAEDVAIYSVAYSVGSIIGLVTSSINSSFAPYQYQQLQMRNYDQLAKTSNRVLGFVAVMLELLMLFGPEIVFIFGGVKYEESISVIVPICIGIYFNYLFQIFARVQEYFERKLTIVIPSILCALLNLILNYFFIIEYGYQAAAYTTFICYLIFCVVHYLFYRRVSRQELGGVSIYDIKGILTISLSVIVGGFAAMFINRIFWLKYSLIVLIVIAILIISRTILKKH